MPSVYQVARAFRRQVLEADQESRTDLIKAYGVAWREIKASLDEMTSLIATARASGESTSSAWLQRQTRYRSLLGQVSQEVGRIAEIGAITLPREQAELVRLAQEHMRELARAQVAIPTPDIGVAASFNRLNPDAVETMVGFFQDGSPLRDGLNELGPAAAEDIAAALRRGVILGESTDAIARRARHAFGGNLVAAKRLSRTALIRTYQEASHQTMLLNRDILNGWYWLAALGAKRPPCASCVALHGSFHPLRERLSDHWQGRCTAVPGVKGETVNLGSGEEWLRRQDEETQAAVLGAESARKAWEAGRVELVDFTTVRRNKYWGRYRDHQSLTDILGPTEALAWRRAA